MNSQTLLQYLQTFLDASTEQEQMQVIQKYPELLSEEVLAQMWELSYVYRDFGESETAQILLELANILGRLREQDLPLDENSGELPPPPVLWARLFRHLLGQAKSEFLDQAIVAAQYASIAGIDDLLRSCRDGDIETVSSRATGFYAELLEKGQFEQAATIAIVDLSIDSSVLSILSHLPIYLRLSRFKQGMKMAQSALDIARTLQDAPCQAHFLTEMGNGYAAVNHFREAVVAYRAAIVIREKLTALHPGIYDGLVARTQVNLGVVLRELHRYHDAEAAYRAALSIYEALNKEFPNVYEDQVATTQNNLGNVLRELHRYLEAETLLRSALITREKLAKEQPNVYETQVATTQNNLSVILCRLYHYPEAETLLRSALITREKLAKEQPNVYTVEVARTYNNLGGLLRDVRRFHEAESAFRTALSIFEPLAKNHPDVYEREVATTQNNLGVVLADLHQDHKSEAAYRTALRIREKLAREQPEVYESQVASTQSNLGIVLRKLDRFQESEAAYRTALRIREKLAREQPEVYESQVASTQNGLASVLSDMGHYDDAKTVSLTALSIYESLAKNQPHIYGSEVARTMNTLGALLNDMGYFDDAEAAFRTSLRIYDRYNTPDNQILVLRNLGSFLIKQKRYEEAVEILERGRVVIERLRTEALNLERQRHVMRDNFAIYQNLVLTLIKLNRKDEALEIAEQGKSRTLIDLMSTHDSEPRNAPADLVRSYKHALTLVRGLQSQTPDTITTEGVPTLDAAYRYYEKLLQRIRDFDPDFLPQARPLDLTTICETAHQADATLLLFYVTHLGAFVFFVLPDGQTDLLSIPDFTTSTLKDLILRFEGEGDESRAVSGWLFDYSNYRKGQGVGKRESFQNTMEAVLKQLSHDLMMPILERLHEHGIARNARLVLIPNGALAILPLHACWWMEGEQKRYWLDEYHIRYAPNIFIFKRALSQEQVLQHDVSPTPGTLLGIIDTRKDLAASVWESEQLLKTLGPKQCTFLRDTQATRISFKQSLNTQQYLHFACHGFYDPAQPLDSALALAGKEVLSVGDMFQWLHLPYTWLVGLSACETSIVSWSDSTDEHYGVATSFLYAGAPTVYATQWVVDDGSTALLMVYTYKLLQSSHDKAQTLRAAQLWLRDLTLERALRALEEFDGHSDSVHANPLRQHLQDLQQKGAPSDYKPFKHPIYWAAFQCVGV